MLTLSARAERTGVKEVPRICRATPGWYFPGRAVGDSDEIDRCIRQSILYAHSPSVPRQYSVAFRVGLGGAIARTM